jgi:xylulokinase
VGATVVCAVGLGLFKSFQEAKKLITVAKSYEPRKQYRGMYDGNFEVFKKLYDNNKKLFSILNR